MFALQPNFRVHPPSRAIACVRFQFSCRLHPLLRVTARVDSQRGLCVRALLQRRLDSGSEEGKRLRSGTTAIACDRTRKNLCLLFGVTVHASCTLLDSVARLF